MKKIYLIAMGMFLLGVNVNAQSKEELKALKEAQKAAEKMVKDAERNYTMSIPNPQYGRKETNFDRLDGAKATIDEAIKNKYNQDNPMTWKVAADIYKQYYTKYEEASKLDESLKPLYIDAATKVVEYDIKYDSLFMLDPKKKEAEKTFVNNQARDNSTNPLLQVLQAAMNYANGETQDDFKKGRSSAALVDRAFKSHLFSSFKHENLEEWKLYAKTMYAQSTAAIEGISGAEVEKAYEQLFGTKFEVNAYNSLINFYRDNNKEKFMYYLKLAYDNAQDESGAQLGLMYIQHLFNDGNKKEAAEAAEKVIQKFPKSDNLSLAYVIRGNILLEDKNYEAAEKFFAEAAAKFPEEETFVPMAARCAMGKTNGSTNAEDFKHAIAMFKELEAKYPDNPDYWGFNLYYLYNNYSVINPKDKSLITSRDKYKKYYNTK